MFLNPGLLISGLNEAVLFVGPRAPATNTLVSPVLSTTDLAILAAEN